MKTNTNENSQELLTNTFNDHVTK